jgi:RNA polymerase sigma-70 factor (family 1)
MPEKQLISDLKAGSHRAFDSIYRLYAKRLYAYCLQYCKQAEDAEEIVEDVFVRLWTSRKNIRQEESLESLLFIMSRHLVINAYRRRLNSPEYEEFIDFRHSAGSEDAALQVEYDEFVARLHRALRTLPATQQRVVKLSRMGGMGNKDIARELNLSEQTVKNQLSLGLKALREKLGYVSPLLELLFLLN